MPDIDTPTRSHIYVLLDRSGSMEAMRDDVIGGFNGLVAEQQADGHDARLTLVQFDSQDPHDVVVDALPIGRIRPLTHRTFVPRGGTPLLDATGLLIAKAAVREEHRRAVGKRPEAVLVVTVTDGQENQSREYRRRDILRLIEEKTARGWSFAFLGAGPDAYAEAGGMGYDPRSVQAFAPDAAGAVHAFASVSRAVAARRGRLRHGEAFEHADFFEGAKEAEEDLRRRHGR